MCGGGEEVQRFTWAASACARSTHVRGRSATCHCLYFHVLSHSSYLAQRATASRLEHTLCTRADMIRRPPTLIQMTDGDVQQVRNMLMRQKAAKEASGQVKAAAPPVQPYHHVEEQKKKREAMSKDERLGLR